MRTPPGYSRPLKRGTGSHLDYPLGAQSGGDDARSTGSTSRPLRKTDQPRFSAHLQDGHRERFHGPGNIILEGVKNFSKGSGATPAWSLVRPHGKPTIKYSHHSSASGRMEARGLLSRVSVRGTLTRRPTQSYARSSTTVASNTERTSCKSTKARAPAVVEYRNRLVRIGRPRAQGRRPLPDTGTGTKAFNAPGVFSPNPTVTGSVI